MVRVGIAESKDGSKLGLAEPRPAKFWPNYRWWAAEKHSMSFRRQRYNQRSETTHMAILVTGGAGYIGSHTAKLLARAGFEPVVFDNLVHGHREAVKWGPFELGDLADRARVAEVFAKYEISAVVHFAAHTLVGESVTNPGKYFRNNSVNTLNLLEAMAEASVKALVFSSTCAIYGLPNVVPIPESHSEDPVNSYGESKRFSEKMMRWFEEAYGLRTVKLRYFNAAGADPEGDLGEEHDPESHLIPIAIAAALGTRKQLDIYGTDYPTPDGTAVRDYIHVSDLAQAHVLALRHLVNGGGSLALNLGTGQGHSVLEVVAAVERASGRKVPVRHADRRAGDPPSLVADSRAAAATLGWTPSYPDLDTIVRDAWRYHSTRASARE
jgi:UDP-glucose-4-epimerase GalE